MNGHYCDNCESHLNDEDYHGYGSWSYTCPDCGFVYHHGRPVGEQVAEFQNASVSAPRNMFNERTATWQGSGSSIRRLV
jgi:hypothetical protein